MVRVGACDRCYYKLKRLIEAKWKITKRNPKIPLETIKADLCDEHSTEAKKIPYERFALWSMGLDGPLEITVKEMKPVGAK